jgi:ATP-dependent DNA helicase RecG
MININTNIKFLKGVGEKKAGTLFSELEMETIEDLLFYFPYRYIDRSKFYKISEINGELPYIQFIGKIIRFQKEGEKNTQRLLAYVADDTGTMELIWFKGIKWITDKYKVGNSYIFFGKPNVFNHKINMAHPDIEEMNADKSKNFSGFQGIYTITETMKRKFIGLKVIQGLLLDVFKDGVRVDETLPDSMLLEYGLMPLGEALKQMHFPHSNELLLKARYRIKFEELFYIQLGLAKTMQIRKRFIGFAFEKVGQYFMDFYEKYRPFDFTNAQKRVIKEIRKDLGSAIQMNRLLQGDVGSGKTLVALMAMLLALDNGFQACLMAPTEILANQHFETIRDLLKQMNLNVRILTGSTKKKQRDIIHEELENGQLHILIGTHALIEDKVIFQNLGLVVIDEQHRFGVAQRAKLWKKNDTPPHILVMTATPIPRTLAMTLYGDLDVSVIDELPPGRKEIKTIHATDAARLRIFGFMREQIAIGRQIYVVYPLIKESEKFDYKDLEDGYNSITRAFPQPQFVTTIVHGKMKPVDKDRSMQLFVSGQANIMVATTVIEVGVNVPNASVMVIESAERFGLSQLHQLRGRVGRGSDQSFCILMTSNKLSRDSRLRMKTMVDSSDGFKIAEVDLKLRGPGDMEGTQQSGIPFRLKLANLAEDGDIIQLVRSIAMEIIDKDPDLLENENQILKNRLKNLKKSNFAWEVIS